MLNIDSVRRLFFCVATTFLITAVSSAQELAVNSTRLQPGVSVQDDQLRIAKEAIEENPFQAHGFVMAARYFDKTDDIVLAAKSYQAAALLETRYEDDAARLEADVNSQRGQLGDTPLQLQARTDLFPTDITSILRLAEIRIVQGATQEADKLVRRATALDMRIHDEEVEALGDFVANAYHIDKHLSYVVKLDSSRINNRLKRFAQAASGYRQLLREYPDNDLLLSEVSVVYANGGDYRSAIRFLDQSNAAKSEREQMLARDAFLMQVGLISEAAQGLVDYYQDYPDDENVSDRLESIYPRLANFPQAKRLIETVRPDLKPVPGTEFNRGTVATARQSAFGLTAYPWVRYVSSTGEDYKYRDNAQGVRLTAFVNGRMGITFGASTHSITSSNSFTDLVDEKERLSRVAVGLDVGGPEFTQRNRQGSYRFMLLLGLSAYSNGKTKPFAESMLEHVGRRGFSTGLELRSSEGVAAGVAPVASQFDSRVSSARV